METKNLNSIPTPNSNNNPADNKKSSKAGLAAAGVGVAAAAAGVAGGYAFNAHAEETKEAEEVKPEVAEDQDKENTPAEQEKHISPKTADEPKETPDHHTTTTTTTTPTEDEDDIIDVKRDDTPDNKPTDDDDDNKDEETEVEDLTKYDDMNVDPDEAEDPILAEDELDPNDIMEPTMMEYDGVTTVYNVDGSEADVALGHMPDGTPFALVDVDADGMIDGQLITDDEGNMETVELPDGFDIAMSDVEYNVNEDNHDYLANNDDNVDTVTGEDFTDDIMA